MPVANTHSRWVNGALVYYDGNDHRKGWLDAIGSNVVKYINDFVVCPRSTAAAMAANNPEWIITHTSAGTGMSEVKNANLTGGVMMLEPASNDNDGIDMQLLGEDFSPKADCPLYFGVRYKCDEKTQSDFILGIVEHETAVIDGASHGIYFGKSDGETHVKLHVVKDVTSDKTVVMTTDVTNTGWHVDEFLVESTGRIDCWHDGTQMTSLTTSAIPTTDMAVTIAFESGAATSTYALYIDWIRCIQINNARTTE